MWSRQEQFTEQGYHVIRGLLDFQRDLRPLREAYETLIADLARIYLSEAGVDEKVDDLPLPEQFAVLLGASRGAALHHLGPVLNVFAPNYEWRSDLPDPRVPEMFQLMRHPRLLDVIEAFIGPEITASPMHHSVLKPAQRDLERAESMAASSGSNISSEPFYKFQVGTTGWHMDAVTVLADAHESNIVNAWIPLTPATEANGCLMVIPGSHKSGVRYKPYPPDLDEQGIALPVVPGDVIFLDNKVMHCSVANTSEDDFRWAFNFRYLKTGQATGRPFLPAFVARSRAAPDTELSDPEIWRRMWVGALDHFVKHGVPFTYEGIQDLSLEDAREMTRSWTQRASDPEDWCALARIA